MKHLYTLTTFLFIITASANSQVVINEVSYTNASLNNNEIGQPEDWIEIYNAGNTSVNLGNYSLMKNNSKEWHFPNISISSHGFLKLLASGRDTLISGVFRHISFKISEGDYNIELKNNMGAVIDQFYIKQELQTDHSYGRITDGGAAFGFFSSPTFGSSNNSAVSFAGYEPVAVISSNGGFFQNSQIVTINVTSTGIIHYTVDGSIPTISSPVYSAPIVINNTKVLAARVFSNNGLLPGPVVKRSFFINEPDLEMPVFSVTIDSIHLWDDTEGMYVEGPAADTAYPHYGANYWKDIEKPCYIEYFDLNHSKKFETAAGLKIFGGYSRTFPQKSFKVKCRSHYGRQELTMPIIPEKKHINSYRDIILRNGGTDNSGTHFRDAFMQRIMKKQFVDYMAYQPAMVYLNGSFWGFYEIRERQDEVYIEKNHGYEKDQIDFLEHAGIIYTIAGTDTGFYNMHNYIITADATSSAYYKKVNSMLDIENFCDYFIAETYYGNTDWIGNWVNNIKFWRPKVPGGKWRYILWDLDFGLGLYSTVSANYLNKARFPFVSNEHSDIFDALLGNTQFRNYFINRYADLINTVYDDRNVQTLASSMKDEVNALMGLHFNKWGGSYAVWNNSINTMLAFNTSRRQIARNHIQAEFNLPNQVDIELDVSPAGAGKIKISTVTPDSLPWKGVYFNGVPVRITAYSNPGYKFSHWSSSTTDETTESFERIVGQNEKFIAHFEKTEFSFQAFPNPVNDKLTVDYELSSEMKVNINVYSIDGRLACSVVNSEIQKEGKHSVPFSFRGNGLANGMYFIKIDAGEDSQTIKITKQ